MIWGKLTIASRLVALISIARRITLGILW
ncbi:hypothetical protein RAZWK3B_16940 [Roseobacter sp. AzwK-3b]|nr:hypothetical protein RAZWK3B_16940 [Roseobacter sp. AzwK-3b]